MRISGVVLLFLVLIHLYVMHLIDAGVERVDFDFVTSRWNNVGWRSFDWVMLFLALLHGANGLRIIIEDYVRSPALRTAIKSTLYTIILILMIMGTAVIVTFDPSGS
jgi:succinate dehydrogenase / fumarate reductase membrane anchor subunit